MINRVLRANTNAKHILVSNKCLNYNLEPEKRFKLKQKVAK